ncbi:oxidoreductase FAD-binding domain-containing protein [Ditylenchus destructor]|nr:oxidoreductase FAD-binding domain-containing protein [Ditylenchus destructor]
MKEDSQSSQSFAEMPGGTSDHHSVTNYAVITTVAVTVGLGAVAAIYFFRGRLPFFGKTKPKVRSKQLKGPVTLDDPEKKYSLRLIKKVEVSPDTRRFVFALPSENHVLGLPVGQHIYVSARINGKLEVRPYTPVSSDDDQGTVEFVIKVYFHQEHPLGNMKFPDGGKMSQHLESLNIGDTLDFRGPNGLIVYKGNGYFEVRASKKDPPTLRHFEEIGLIAGGTGITPQLQIISDILKHPDDPTKISLLFANQTERDILLREELERLQEEHPTRLKVWFTIDRPSDDWKYSVGFVSAEMIAEHLPVHNANFKERSTECGPPPMIKFACGPSLDKLNFPVDNRFMF